MLVKLVGGGIKSGKCSLTYSFVPDLPEYPSLMCLENMIITGSKKNGRSNVHDIQLLPTGL